MTCPYCGVVADAPFHPAGCVAEKPELVLGSSLPPTIKVPDGEWRITVSSACPHCHRKLYARAVFHGHRLHAFTPTGPFLSVAEAQRRIHDPEVTHGSDKVMAAVTLMEYCEHDLQITFHDMLRCLDYGGTIAEMGARCLYIRTGRDGLGWKTGGPSSFVVDRANWEKYLREHYFFEK